MRTETIRGEVQRRLKQVPFRPFAMSLENGDRVVIEHPENIAFDPGENGSGGSRDFYVISGNLHVYATFDAVTSVAMIDQHDVVA